MKKRFLLVWCRNSQGHPNKDHHGFYIPLGKIGVFDWLRKKALITRACSVCGTGKDLKASRIVKKEVK